MTTQPDGGLPWVRIFVEGVVIVGSILLALAADAWWDGRQDREAERDALLLIHADLVADTIELSAGQGIAERYWQAAGWMLDHYDDPTVTIDDLDRTLGAFLRWQPVQPQNAAYRSTRDASRLALIENDTLRAAIVRYFEEMQVAFAQRADRVYYEREALMEALSPHFRWWTAPGEDGFVTNVRLTSRWGDVQGDNRLHNQISTVRSASVPGANLARDSRSANDELRAMIQAELEARW